MFLRNISILTIIGERQSWTMKTTKQIRSSMTLLIITALIVFSLFPYAYAAPKKAKPKPKPTPTIGTKSDNIIVGGKRVSSIELGQPIGKYEKVLGPYKVVGSMFDYHKQGITLMVKNGIVEGIMVYSPTYKTPEGIRVGMPTKKLKEKYGNYLVTEAGALVYTELGLAFNEKDSKITRIMVVPATPDPLLGDKLIIPGDRAGNIKIGMDISRVEKLWGKPTSVEKHPNNDKVFQYKYEQKGVVILVEDGIISGVRILSYKFQTREGISVKSTKEQVINTYGKRYKEVEDSINYKSLGIGFYFRKGEVLEILLTQKAE